MFHLHRLSPVNSDALGSHSTGRVCWSTSRRVCTDAGNKYRATGGCYKAQPLDYTCRELLIMATQLEDTEHAVRDIADAHLQELASQLRLNGYVFPWHLVSHKTVGVLLMVW